MTQSAEKSSSDRKTADLAPADQCQRHRRRVVGLLDLLVRLPRWLRAMVPVAGMLTLWWSSAQVPVPQPHSTAESLFHNSMHVVAYACLAASVWVAWTRRSVAMVHVFRSRGAWSIAFLYGIVDELHQSFVPGRVCSLSDLVSDAAGAALAVVVLRGVVGIAPRWCRVAGALLCASLASVAAATFANW